MDTSTAIAQAITGFTVSLVVTWLVFMLPFGAAPAAWLANARGREPFLWLAIGLLIGPLAALLVGLAPLGTRGDYRRCPRCCEAIRSEALVCPYCAWDALAPTVRPNGTRYSR